MSLAGEFSHTYPEDITLSSEWCDVSQSVDYSGVISGAFGEFINSARGACPVRTGNLLSSISGGADSNGFYGVAGADYAEYVEYGTSKMAAQPFFVEPFESAAEVAIEGIISTLSSSVSEAQAIARAELDERYTMEEQMAIEEFMANMAGGVDADTFFGLLDELRARLHELVMIYAECSAQIEAQAEEYLSQGSADVSIS